MPPSFIATKDLTPDELEIWSEAEFSVKRLVQLLIESRAEYAELGESYDSLLNQYDDHMEACTYCDD